MKYRFDTKHCCAEALQDGGKVDRKTAPTRTRPGTPRELTFHLRGTRRLMNARRQAEWGSPGSSRLPTEQRTPAQRGGEVGRAASNPGHQTGPAPRDPRYQVQEWRAAAFTVGPNVRGALRHGGVSPAEEEGRCRPVCVRACVPACLHSGSNNTPREKAGGRERNVAGRKRKEARGNVRSRSPPPFPALLSKPAALRGPAAERTCQRANNWTEPCSRPESCVGRG